VSDPPRRGDPLPLLRLLLACGGVCWLGACGVQGPPVPPRVEQPQRVSDLAAAQAGRTITLSFTAPQLAADGERLTKPLEAEILRAVIPAGQPAPPSSEALQAWVALSAGEFAKLAKSARVVYFITLTKAEFREHCGATYLFTVRTLTRRFRRRVVESRLSNVVQMTLLDVPLSVEDLHVATTEHALELSWKPPQRAVSGELASRISAYRVYRRVGKTGAFEKIGEISDPLFRDMDFAFGRTYTYKVAALMKVGTQTAEGEASPETEVTPRDIFPPAAPTGLTAVYTAQVIELVWTANSEPDLAGYNVYRREGSGPVQRMNPEPLRTPIFRDRSVAEGRQYFYRVTALDLANNESAPSEEARVGTH
jgi:hypothetical protein